MTKIRDSNGNLVAFNGKELLGLEIMLTTFQGRLERIESNQGDVKIIQNEMRKEMKEISKTLSVFCQTFHETVSDVNAANKKSNDALETASEALASSNESKKVAIDINERIDTFFKSLALGSKITGAVVAVAAFVFAIIEYFKK